MKVSSQTIENRQMLFEVEAEPDEVEKSLSAAYHHLVNRIEVPGFRRGKAPRSMLERHIGRGALLEEAIEHLVPELLGKAIDEQKIDIIARPQIEITKMEPVVFKATVSLPPTVELGDYSGIRIDKEPVTVDEAEVDKVIEQVRLQNATWEPVERPVKFEDLVAIDLFGTVDGEKLVEQKDFQIQVHKDMPVPVPGFSEQIEGMEKGQEKEFELSIPADFKAPKIAGKTCSFKVKLNEVKEQKLPEVNDDFAKGLGGDFDNVENMRKNITANLNNVYQVGAMRRFEQKVLEAVVEKSKLEFPPVLVEQEIDRVIMERERELAARRMTLEDFLKSQKKSIDELRESLRPLASKQVAISLVVDKVAEKENIKVTPEEIEAEIQQMVQSAGERGEEMAKVFQSPEPRNSIGASLAVSKAVKLLMDIASNEAKTGTEAAKVDKKSSSGEDETK
jgi:trigger factor